MAFPPLAIQNFISRSDCEHSHHRVAAEVATATITAEVATPDGIELLDKRFDKCGVVGENAVLEVALLLRLCAHPGTGEIRRAEIRLHAVDDDALEMHPRTKHPLHRRPERRIAVEVVAPVRARVLRMNKPHLDAALHHPVKHLQERHHLPSTRVNIHVLDIRGRDPQSLPRLRHDPADDGGVDVTVGEKGGHGYDYS